MDTPAVVVTRGGRRRWRRILLAVALVLVLVLAFLTFGLSPNVPTEHVRLVRGQDGQLQRVDGADPSRFVSFELEATALGSTNNYTFSVTSTNSDNAGFACSRLVIINRSSHLLMACVGRSLLDQLESVPYVHQIDYYPAGFGPAKGGLAPDMVITLDLDQLTESRWPGFHSVEAIVKVAAGNGPPDCRNSYVDHLTPPLMQFDCQGSLTHSSVTKGVSTSAAKYKAVANDIAKQLASQLTGEFSKRRDAEGVAQELPASFYPAYRDPPALPFDKFGNLKLVTAWHGLMNHNETLWRLTVDRPATEVFAGLEQRMKDAGWRTDSHSADYLRMELGEARLAAYIPSPRIEMTNSSANPSIIYVYFIDRMTEEEVRQAIDDALDNGVSAKALLCFRRLWSDDQARRILQALASRPAQTPQISLALADLYHQLGQDEEARHEILHTRALLETVWSNSDLQSRARDLAKKLGDEKLADGPIEPRVLDELGFTELKLGVAIPPREVGVDEPVHFYTHTADGLLKTISVRVVRSPSDELPYKLAFVESKANSGRSSGSMGTGLGLGIDDQCRVHFSIERLEPAERFRLQTQVQ